MPFIQFLKKTHQIQNARCLFVNHIILTFLQVIYFLSFLMLLMTTEKNAPAFF